MRVIIELNNDEGVDTGISFYLPATKDEKAKNEESQVPHPGHIHLGGLPRTVRSPPTSAWLLSPQLDLIPCSPP